MKTLLTIGLVLTALFNLVSCAPEPIEEIEDNCGTIIAMNSTTSDNVTVCYVTLDNNKIYVVDGDKFKHYYINLNICLDDNQIFKY